MKPTVLLLKLHDEIPLSEFPRESLIPRRHLTSSSSAWDEVKNTQKVNIVKKGKNSEEDMVL